MADFGSPLQSFPPPLLATEGRTESYGSPALGSRIPSTSAISPRMALSGGVHGEGPEVARRALEWERQIETLDQKEMEIHQTQLRLIRDQMGTFRQDLVAMRQELMDLKSVHNKHASMHGEAADRISNSERGLQEFSDSIGKHGSLFQDVDRKLQQMTGNINELHRVIQRHATERLDSFEKAVEDTTGKHSRAIQEAEAKLEALHSRLSTQENSHSELKRAHSDKEIKQSTLTERLSYLDKFANDSVEKHWREIEAIKSAQDKVFKDSNSRHASLEQLHASIQSRLNYLEGMVGDSADKHAKELEAVRASVGKLSGGVQAATVAERLAFLEQTLGDSADKHAAELQVAQSKLDRMGSHGEVLESLKRGHQEFHKNLMAYSVAHTTQNDRLAYIEKVLGDSSEKHWREIESLKSASSKLAVESKGHAQSNGKVSEKLDNMLKQHATVEDRITYIERMMGDSIEKHAREITGLKTAHNNSQVGAKEAHAKHLSLEERLEYIEKTLHDFSEKQLREIDLVKGAHAKLVGDGKDARVKSSSLEERVDYIDNWFRGFQPR